MACDAQPRPFRLTQSRSLPGWVFCSSSVLHYDFDRPAYVCLVWLDVLLGRACSALCGIENEGMYGCTQHVPLSFVLQRSRGPLILNLKHQCDDKPET